MYYNYKLSKYTDYWYSNVMIYIIISGGKLQIIFLASDIAIAIEK